MMRFFDRQYGQLQTSWSQLGRNRSNWKQVDWKEFCRGGFCVLLTMWMVLTTVGFSSASFDLSSAAVGANPIHNCCCDLQKQRSSNCCCYPVKASGASKSCCVGGSEEEPQQDDTEPSHPQFNSYCGTSVPTGTIINREPRLDTERLVSTPDLHLDGLLVHVDETSASLFDVIDPPPPQA
ncbi:hypothetical protein [Thalassoglobus sp.]|uniref:hypothetical protein n=1 Tax=Thalassoglobus sp. TaxID=2795869 RepID=UPI003AA96F6F